MFDRIWIKTASGWKLAQSPDFITVKDRESSFEKGWLGSISGKKPEDAMKELPTDATDPFLTPQRRLRILLDIYRIEEKGNILDWAKKQSGYEDPLSEYTRDQLQAFYKEFARNRDTALYKLLNDMQRKREPFMDIMKDAPFVAFNAMRKMGLRL